MLFVEIVFKKTVFYGVNCQEKYYEVKEYLFLFQVFPSAFFSKS